MKKLDKNILKTLRGYYLLFVWGMALSEDEGTGYRRHENAAAQTSFTVFALFGHVVAETLRKPANKKTSPKLSLAEKRIMERRVREIEPVGEIF